MTRQSLDQYGLAGHLLDVVARRYPDMSGRERLAVAHRDALNAILRTTHDGHSRIESPEMWRDVATELQIQIDNSVAEQADMVTRFVKSGMPQANIAAQIDRARYLSRDTADRYDDLDQPEMGDWWREVADELTTRLIAHMNVVLPLAVTA